DSYSVPPALTSFPTRRSSDLKSSRQLVEMLLLEMTEEGILSEVVPGKYKLLSLAAQITGTVDMTAAGSAYIVPDEGGEDIFVSQDRKSTRLNSSHVKTSYAVF